MITNVLPPFYGSQCAMMIMKTEKLRTNVIDKMRKNTENGHFNHRHSQGFVCGVLLFPEKVNDLFSRRPQNTR